MWGGSSIFMLNIARFFNYIFIQRNPWGFLNTILELAPVPPPACISLTGRSTILGYDVFFPNTVVR